MINFCMQPDIKYKSKIFSRFSENCDSTVNCSVPILGVYKELTRKPLLIIAEGGQGKTTSVQILKAELLYSDIPCYMYDCNNMSFNDFRILTTPSVFVPNSVLIFDGWDECPENRLPEMLNLISTLLQQSLRVIITSRYNPSTQPRLKEDEKAVFDSFEIAEMCPFTKAQILELIGSNVDIDSRFFDLMSNAMYLSMYLNISPDNRTNLLETENSYQFIYEYLKSLLNCKHQSISSLDKLLYDVGEQVYNELVAEETNYSTNINSFSALNHIIFEHEDETGNWRIHTTHFRYKAFCLSVYLKSKLKSHLKYNLQSPPEALSFRYNHNYLEALIFLGESIDFDFQEKIKALINYSNMSSFTYNLLYILLGSNHQCFDDLFFAISDRDIVATFEMEQLDDADIEIVLLVDAPELFQAPPSFLYLRNFLFRNEYITSIFIHSISKVGANGNNRALLALSNLKKIEVAQGHSCFYAKDNCLIRKVDNALILGCFKSEIPNGVSLIERAAFWGCNKLEKIEIPNSVSIIEHFAFDGCHNLNELIVPDSVTAAYNIVPNCDKLQRLHIGAGLRKIDCTTFDLARYVTVYPSASLYNNLVEITVSAANADYYSQNNCLIEKATETVILGCKTSIIPTRVRTIGENAFSCIETDEITIPLGVEQIKYNAFAGSTIKRCTLPNTITQLEERAFGGCRYLKQVEIPQSLQEIGADAFYRADIDMLIVPAGNSLYGSMGIWYDAHYKIETGDIYRREADDSLTPPPYYASMKEQAHSVLEELVANIDFHQSFQSIDNYVREEVDKRINNTFPKNNVPWEQDPAFIKQKAHLYILQMLNQSDSIDSFIQHVKTGNHAMDQYRTPLKLSKEVL